MPHRIVAAGALVRAPAQDRIAFLAAARNAALAPLWEGNPGADAASEGHFRLLKQVTSGQLLCGRPFRGPPLDEPLEPVLCGRPSPAAGLCSACGYHAHVPLLPVLARKKQAPSFDQLLRSAGSATLTSSFKGCRPRAQEACT